MYDTYRQCSFSKWHLNLQGLECGLGTRSIEAMQATCAGHAACHGYQVLHENWFCNHPNSLGKVLKEWSERRAEHEKPFNISFSWSELIRKAEDKNQPARLDQRHRKCQTPFELLGYCKVQTWWCQLDPSQGHMHPLLLPRCHRSLQAIFSTVISSASSPFDLHWSSGPNMLILVQPIST